MSDYEIVRNWAKGKLEKGCYCWDDETDRKAVAEHTIGGKFLLFDGRFYMAQTDSPEEVASYMVYGILPTRLEVNGIYHA